MSKLKIVTISGNLGAPSKTLALAEQILAALRNLNDIDQEIYQLADLAAVFGPARHPGELPPAGHAVLEAIASADILLAVTPVYKGSYTGLFKHVFDFLDPKAIIDVPVILAASAGGDKHALVIEHQLRPLFGFFGALTVPSGIYAAEQSFLDGKYTDPVVLERIETAAAQAIHAANGRKK